MYARNIPALSLVLLALVAAAPGEERSGTVALTLRLDGVEQPAEETVVLWPGDSAGSAMEREVVLPGTSSFQVPPGEWTLSLKHYDRHWFPPQVIVVGPGTHTEVAATVVRTAEVVGRVEAPEGVEAPARVEVYFERSQSGPPVGTRPSLFGRRECPVADHELRCFLPAAALDLRVVVPGFSDLFFWQTRLAPGKRHKLPPRRLQEGATVFGWIVRPDGEALADVAVELAPAGLFVADFPGAELRTIRARTDPRGFFQLAGARPGAYSLRAVAEDAQSARIAVEVADAAVAVDPAIVLYPPNRLQVYLQPPQTPGDGAWELGVYPAWEGALIPSQEGLSADLSGLVTADGLPAGRYHLIVTDPVDDSRWATEEVTVHGGSDEVVQVEIPVLEIEGTVELGRRPVEAEVAFTDRAEETSVTLSSNVEGELRGAVPGEGAYMVAVSGSGIHYEQQVELEAGPDGVAQLELKIPDTLIEGRVVEAGRRPVSRATLMLDGGEKPRSLTKTGGEFEVRGLEPGTYRITASSVSADGGPLASVEPEVVHLDGAEAQVRGVEVEVHPIRVVSGRVISDRDGTPVPGAQVWASAPGAFPLSFLAVADGDGRFESRVPKTAGQLEVILEPPGHGYQIQRMPASDEVTLVAASGHGTLEIETDVDGWSWSAPRLFLLSDTGAALAYQVLSWAQAHGAAVDDFLGDAAGRRTLTLPAMATGRWSVCLVDPRQAGLVARDPQTRMPDWICDSGVLGIGEELTLKVTSSRP